LLYPLSSQVLQIKKIPKISVSGKTQKKTYTLASFKFQATYVGGRKASEKLGFLGDKTYDLNIYS